MGELKIISALRLICLTPIFLVYGAWIKFISGNSGTLEDQFDMPN